VMKAFKQERPAILMDTPRRFLSVAGLVAAFSVLPYIAAAQSTIPPEYRGSETEIARGILNGNLIETNFRNHGELARWDDNPWGVWPRGIGGRHVDGVGVLVSGRVPGERGDGQRGGGCRRLPRPGGTSTACLRPAPIRVAGSRKGSRS